MENGILDLLSICRNKEPLWELLGLGSTSQNAYHQRFNRTLRGVKVNYSIVL